MTTITEAAMNTAASYDKLTEMLEEHRVMSAKLKELKKKESDLRDEIVLTLKEKGRNVWGTHTIFVENMKVKMVLGRTYSLDEDALQECWDQLTEEEQNCIRYKPSLIMDNYNILPDEVYALDEFIIVKPKKPTLSVTLTEE